MSRMVISPPVPYVVAQRLRNLLHGFPAAATCGVQWQTLMHQYEARHKLPLDLASLGHSSPLGAATALLWDVLRLVDSEDPLNPVVALDDREVLNARAPSFAAWPSIYQAMCGLVEEAEAERSRSKGEEKDAIPGVPLSQLKGLLRQNWHKRFGEDGLAYLTEEGCAVKLESMEDLVEAVLMWREERQIWRSAVEARYTAVDEALVPELDIAPLGPWGELHLCRACEQPPAPCAKVTPPRQLIRRLSTMNVARVKTGEDAANRMTDSPGAASTAPSEGEEEDEEAEEEVEKVASLAKPAFLPEELPPVEEHQAPKEEGAMPFKEAAAARRASRPSFDRAKTMPLTLGDRVQIPAGAVQNTKALFERKNSNQAMPSFYVQAQSGA